MGNSIVIHPKICHKGGVSDGFCTSGETFFRNWPA